MAKKKAASRQKNTRARREARRRWSLVMQQLGRDGITQEHLARAMSDENDDVSISSVQKWATGVNLPDFVSVGRLLEWMGRKGWIALWALGMDERQMRELAKGIAELHAHPEQLLRMGAPDPKEARLREALLAKAAKARSGKDRTTVIREL